MEAERATRTCHHPARVGAPQRFGEMARRAVPCLLFLAALPAAAAFLPMAAPGRLGVHAMRGVSARSMLGAPRPMVRSARRAAQGCVALRADASDGLLDKIDAGEFELLLMV